MSDAVPPNDIGLLDAVYVLLDVGELMLIEGLVVSNLNVADTLLFEVIDTWQLPVPLQAPPQPLNVYPLAGLALRVTLVPLP